MSHEHLSPREAHRRLIEIEKKRDLERDKRYGEILSAPTPTRAPDVTPEVAALALAERTRLASALFDEGAQTRLEAPRRNPDRLRKRYTTILTTRDAYRMVTKLRTGEFVGTWIRDAILERLSRLDQETP